MTKEIELSKVPVGKSVEALGKKFTVLDYTESGFWRSRKQLKSKCRSAMNARRVLLRTISVIAIFTGISTANILTLQVLSHPAKKNCIFRSVTAKSCEICSCYIQDTAEARQLTRNAVCWELTPAIRLIYARLTLMMSEVEL